ncbi:MAG: hypothetical protein RLP44_22055 [Aggregatilineales bacterium]
MLTIVQVFGFGFALWLGGYLIARDLSDWRLRFAGLGLITYALGLGMDALIPLSTDNATLIHLRWSSIFLPSLFWFGTIVESLPENSAIRHRLPSAWRTGLLIFALIVFIIGAGTNFILTFTASDSTVPRINIGYAVFALTVTLPAAVAFYLMIRHFRQSTPRPPYTLLTLITVLFMLGVSLIVLPLDLFPLEITVLAIEFDLLILGILIAFLDAFDLGESIVLDMTRSFVFSGIAALGLGGQIALIMLTTDGLTFTAMLLILTLSATGILLVTFAAPLQNLLDQLVFSRFPQIQQERRDLRAATIALARKSSNPPLLDLDDDSFTRLTRRTLSHYGDLTKLAASPLTQLPIITTRIEHRNARDDTLERATELKRLLTESIARLKPLGDDSFGTSDEWRYYNALYFPYVIGVKPYSRRLTLDDLDPATREALTWFQAQVPERTLYNWQNAAASLIAQDLRERV